MLLQNRQMPARADGSQADAVGGASGGRKRSSGAKSGAHSLTTAPAPLQVSFHPRKAHILASGSLDFEVRVWDAVSAACLVATNFGAQRWKAVPCARPAR